MGKEKDTHIRLPKAVGKVLQMTGFLEKAPSSPSTAQSQELREDVTQSVQDEAPSIPTSLKKASAVQAVDTTQSNETAVDPTVEQQAKRYLAKVLDATSPKFQDYLKQRKEMLTTLSDTLSGDKLDRKTTEVALKSAKLTMADAKSSLAAARVALGSLKTDFASEFQKERKKQISEPKQRTRDAQNKITEINAEIARLDTQKKELEASIQSDNQAIEASEQQLQEGQEIFRRSCENVENSLSVLEQQITHNLK